MDDRPVLPSDHWQEPDFLLADIVSFMANKLEVGLGITLMCRGAVYTGTLVGEREFLRQANDLLKTLVRDSLPGASRAELKEVDSAFIYDRLFEDQYVDPNAPDDEAADAYHPQPIRFLHLQDPVIIYPGSTISFTESALPIMRIRLTEIDGWMMGRITIFAPEHRDRGGMPDSGFIQ